PSRAEDLRIRGPGALAHHPSGRHLPGPDRGAARHPDPEIQRTLLLRRHQRADRRGRGAGYAPADGIASAHAPLRGVRAERQASSAPMRVVLLGAPGSGKGTHGKRLAEEVSAPVVATGDVLREAIAEGTALG